MEIVNLLLFGGALAVAGAGTWFALSWQARSTLNAHLVLDAREVKVLGEVPVQVHLRPRQPVQVNRVVARTRCLRRSVEGPGREGHDLPAWTSFFSLGDSDETWIERDEVARAEVELSGPFELRAGQARSFEAVVPVADGVPTDDSGPLSISWVLEVAFDIPHSPDVTLRRPLRVRRRY